MNVWLAFLLIVLFLVALPVWPYSAMWGYGPSGLLGLLFMILLMWLLATPGSPGRWRRVGPPSPPM
jgi:hypothetical protein